jgi:C4-dicarboxylate transporter DctM subunit
MTTAFLFTLLFTFLLIRIPIAVSLGLSSVLTILLFANDSISSLAEKIFHTMYLYTLMAIPFFILASTFLTTGGVARRLIRFATDCVGWLPGGLAIASVFACMMFAAVSGSSPATVVAIGSIVIAGMVQQGYPLNFAAGVICNAGTLGILIPPSIVMVVYCAATEVSVGRLFMAGVVPGLLLGLFLMGAIYLTALRKQFPAQPFPGFKEMAKSAFSASGGLLLIIIIMGGIYGGIFTPTEAAAVSAVYAFLIALCGYRDLGPIKHAPWRKEGESIGRSLLRNIGLTLLALVKSPVDPEVRDVLVNAAKVSIMLLFIISNAVLFAHVLTTERIPHMIAETIVGWGLAPWSFLIVVNVLLLIAGNFMEPSAITLIMAPILFPIAVRLGIDPIHLGIVMVINMEIGMVTPPVGLNLFVTAGITSMPLTEVIRAAFPWLLVLVSFLICITYIPWISTFLPIMLMGPEIVTH